MKNKRILVAVQEREHLESLIRLAWEMSKGTQSEVVALHVVEVGLGLPLDAEAEVLDRPGGELLAEAQRVARYRFGEEILTRLVRGREAGPAIVREAEEQGAELLILGYRPKKSRVAKAFLGSTVEYVTDHAPSRVLVQVLPFGIAQEAAA
ncbi:MAG TPA: universal stress protein [Terriglobales bacterium]